MKTTRLELIGGPLDGEWLEYYAEDGLVLKLALPNPIQAALDAALVVQAVAPEARVGTYELAYREGVRVFVWKGEQE